MTTGLRLGLLFFDEKDTSALRASVAALRPEHAAWTVADEAPYDALLLARGTRTGDAEDVAVLRLSAAAEAKFSGAARGVVPSPIALPKPFDVGRLREALEQLARRLSQLAAGSGETSQP